MRSYILYALGALVLISATLAGGYGLYQYRALESAHEATRAELASTTGALTREQAHSSELGQELEKEQRKNGTFEAQIKSISSTVGTLDKLAQTDEELLAKYSKVYFLSEHYAPTELSTIDSEYVYPDNKELLLHAEVLPQFEALMRAAHKDGVDIRALSAYRSFTTQSALKNNYRVTYGTGANAFSADQGYSEHQLGTTVDFTTVTSKGSLVGFDATPAFTWLTQNAHKYGFVLSYPRGNGYYQYEPWHWRYVGEKLATRLHQDDAYFYELDQREINSYLLYLFD